MLDATEFRGPLVVTAAYFGLWCFFLLGLQRGTKYRLVARYRDEGQVFDRYFSQDPEMLAVDRVVANTHEQMGPFLVALWLYALFVSPSQATWLGGGYVLLRAAYPLLLGKRVSKIQTKRVGFVTIPAYLLIFGMLGVTVASAFGG